MTPRREIRYPVPVATNVTLMIVGSLLYFTLLHAASRTTSALGLATTAVLFVALMVMLYGLIHEAEHDILLPDRAWNLYAGRWLCAMFGVSFAFLRHCHLRHHVKNRTDVEVWDLCLEHHVPWQRRLNLYLMLSGLGYFLLWVSVILFALAPAFVYRLFNRHTELAGFLAGSERRMRAIRRESWMVIAFQSAMFLALQLDPFAYLVLFAAHGFVWCSQNYATHAYAPRDIINGAHNLSLPPGLRFVYLNFNLHLAHHQNPRIPWIHLPGFVQPSSQRLGFYQNYMRLWCGPRRSTEKNPVIASRALK
jgi:fatty acid desaturase